MLKTYGIGRGGGRAACSKSSMSVQPTNADATANSLQSVIKKKQPGEIRMQKELSDLELSEHFALQFPDKDNLMHFYVNVCPDIGYWKGRCFRFVLTVPDGYPHDPPKVKCETPVFHPNIDSNGNVCLNILREDWKPILSISSVIYGLLHLFLEPNCTDPLNKEAADLLSENPLAFARTVGRQR